MLEQLPEDLLSPFIYPHPRISTEFSLQTTSFSALSRLPQPSLETEANKQRLFAMITLCIR